MVIYFLHLRCDSNKDFYSRVHYVPKHYGNTSHTIFDGWLYKEYYSKSWTFVHDTSKDTVWPYPASYWGRVTATYQHLKKAHKCSRSDHWCLRKWTMCIMFCKKGFLWNSKLSQRLRISLWFLLILGGILELQKSCDM